ncbi:6-phosphogluconolactonase [Hyphomonas sp.]|uniref:6-phosphogluconolactonase n=1 Tax=Hyphomonas sp. TaxID=87 RepID=UPI003528CBB4
MKHELSRFDTRDAALDFSARFVAGGLENAIADRGRADFLTSGGSTPGPLFDRLSGRDLPWECVSVGLVDERWVPPDSEEANETLVRSRLLKGKAGAAGLIPMKTGAIDPREAVADRNAAYSPHCSPIDVILLGMGSDGHTASWFPRSKGLNAALVPPNGEVIAAIDATGCPGAGANTQRLTLTGPAVTSARMALMLLFGDEKLEVLERALASDPQDMPVRHAVDKLGPRLTIIWAP